MSNGTAQPSSFIERKGYNRYYLALLAIIATNILWAWAPPIIKSTLEYIPLFTFLFYRMLFVCLILLPFIIIEIKKNPVNPRDYINFIILGLTGQSSILLIFWGLEYTSSIDVVLIGLMVPFLSVAVGYYLFNEKITKFTKLGLLVATIGGLVIVFEPLTAQEAGQIAQILLSHSLKTLEDDQIYLTFSDLVIKKIVDESYDEEAGARNMRRYIGSTIEDFISRLILEDKLVRGTHAVITTDANGNYISQ